MIKNPEYLADFENSFIAKNTLSYEQSLAIFESLWQEALSLGFSPLSNPLEGIEKNIKIARVLNSCLKT